MFGHLSLPSFVLFINIKSCKHKLQTYHMLKQVQTCHMLTQLQTSGSLDEQNRLVVTGRFAPADFEVSLQRYISEFCLLFLAPKQIEIVD